MSRGPGDLNNPFKATTPRPWTPPADVQLSGGVRVMAATATRADGTTAPIVMFQFARPDGSGFYPLIALCPDDVADLVDLAGLVEAAIAAAVKGAES